MNLRGNKVSVIMPAYNASKFIGDAIESVINQSYENWELLVVDDFSIDETVVIVEEYQRQDSRIRLIKAPKNGGVAKARNMAIKEASGRFIAFLDSDDIWLKDKLEKQISFMLSNNYAFTFTDYQIMNEDGSLTSNIIKMPKSLSYNQHLRNTVIGTLTVILDKAQIGDFRMVEIRTSEDFATWLMIQKRIGDAYALNKVLSFYRVSEGSLSANKFNSAKDVWLVYRKIENLSLLKSCCSFIGYAYNAVKKRI